MTARWTSRIRTRLLLVAAILCVASGAAGLHVLWRFAYTPGPAAADGPWPADAAIPRHPSRRTLVVFLHPQCTCSQATLHELARTLNAVSDPPEAYAFVLRPSGMADALVHAALWDAAHAIPNLHMLEDPDGRTAARFGARVSGDTMLFAADGTRLFNGGITESRGHIGTNPGSTALRTLLAGGATSSVRAPVFGCLLAADGASN